MKQQKIHLSDELDATRSELEGRKEVCTELENKLRDSNNEVALV
jgi:hypothetical protein